jgi:biopolymer transport protein ExbB
MDQENIEPVVAAPEPAFPFLPEAIADIAAAGGPVVAILAVLSVIATAIGILKFWQFASSGLFSDRLERRAAALWREGRPLEALACVQGARNPVAATLGLAIRGKLARELEAVSVREEVARYGADRLEALQSYLRPLEVIGSLAPLLGLFGTVLGMIEAFRQMEAAGSQVDPSVLSGGIWEALLTTAVGLAVAIPAVALLNWLERTIEKARHRMEDAVTLVFAPDLSSVAVSKAEPRVEQRHLQSTGR